MAGQSGDGPASLVILVWGIDTNINNIGLNKWINKQQIAEDDTLAPRGHKGENRNEYSPPGLIISSLAIRHNGISGQTEIL